MRYLDRLQPLALLMLRLVLGVIMVAHGYPKVFGGMQKHISLVSSLGLPWWWAYLSAAAEFVGGLLVIAGLLTRFAALAICINMVVAVSKVHWAKGFFVREGGYEFALAVATMAFVLIFLGSGPISLDWVFHRGGGEGGNKKGRG